MSLRQTLTDFFIEYDHDDNVVHLNTPYARDHAIANARQAAMTLEEDREAVQRELAAMVNPETIREQQQVIRNLEAQLGIASRLIKDLLDTHGFKATVARLQARNFLARERVALRAPTESLRNP